LLQIWLIWLLKSTASPPTPEHSQRCWAAAHRCGRQLKARLKGPVRPQILHQSGQENKILEKPRYMHIYNMCIYHIYIWYDMIWYDMIWYDIIWYYMIWYDMIYIYIWYIFIYYIDIHIIYVIVIYRPFCWTFAADWICSVHSDPTELITGWARAPQAWEAQTSRWIAGEIRWNHGINGEWPLILSWWIFDWRIKLKPLQSTLIQLQNWDFGSLHIQSSTRNIRFCQHLQSKSYSPRALVSIPAWALGDVFFGLWCDSRTWLYDTNGSNQP
jgi:hypothetical protein